METLLGGRLAVHGGWRDGEPYSGREVAAAIRMVRALRELGDWTPRASEAAKRAIRCHSDAADRLAVAEQEMKAALAPAIADAQEAEPRP
ncbi:MAG: hypothetical protein M3N43_00865 [Actinomycetota bacterium]|nr:hypothetical protein [Actinomycetota bacterium]